MCGRQVVKLQMYSLEDNIYCLTPPHNKSCLSPAAQSAVGEDLLFTHRDVTNASLCSI